MSEIIDAVASTSRTTPAPMQVSGVTAIPLPPPRIGGGSDGDGGGGGGLKVRAANAADLAFIDALQKMHDHMVGFLRYPEIEKHIAEGITLIAEDAAGTPIGYCIARDQYMKRDDVGIVYQLNVLPLKQRHLVGASLVKAVFAKAAYGCRLFCCWCAQDIQANWFWESIGFVPLAFRTGSRKKQRIHVFWQRRVRENDDSTPYWFPSQTSGGAVGEDRIVLPIPPGTHWRDAKPLVLPGVERSAISDQQSAGGEPRQLPANLPGGALVKPRPEQVKLTQAQKAAIHRMHSKHLGGVPVGRKAVLTASGVKYIERTDFVAETDTPEELEALIDPHSKKKPRAARVPRAKNDPKYVAAARELRDRFLEEVNIDRLLPTAHGKYDVSRQIEAAGSGSTMLQHAPLLEQKRAA